MIRKLLMTAAILALTFGTLHPGTAEARPWGYHGWGYAHVWGPYYYGYRVWAPAYPRYVVAPYYGPHCYVTVYGTAVCY